MKTKNTKAYIAAAAIAPTLCVMSLDTDPQQTKGSGSSSKKPTITEIKIEWPGKYPERVETPQGQDKQGNELPPETWYTEPFEDTFLNVGEEWEVEFELTPKDADATTLIWKSSDPNVAKVSKGVVTGLKLGETEITATTPNRKVRAKITVIVTEPIEE